MTMKNDAKFEEELTCHFKIDMRNLINFDLSTWKSQNFHFTVKPVLKTTFLKRPPVLNDHVVVLP